MVSNKQELKIQSGGAFGASIIFGTWVLILRNVTLPGYFVTIVTSFTGFLGLLVYAIVSGKKSSLLNVLKHKKLIRLIVLVALFEAVQNALFMIAFQLAILNGGSVFIPVIRAFIGIITPIIAIFVAKKDFSFRYLAYGVLATLGAIIIFSWKGLDAGGRVSYVALLLVTISVVVLSVEYIFQRFMAIEMSLSKQLESNVVTYQTIFSAVFLSPLIIYFFSTSGSAHVNIGIQVLFISIFGLTHVALAFILRLNALRHITASQGVIIGYIEQVVSISLSVLLLRETINMGFIVGAVLIIGSAIAAGMHSSRSR
jgi:drug/metabolite transporter (DMT)-like permease